VVEVTAEELVVEGAELVLLLVLHDTVKQQTAKVVKRKFFMYVALCGFNIQELPTEIKLPEQFLSLRLIIQHLLLQVS
jgi:hypothetical protein